MRKRILAVVSLLLVLTLVLSACVSPGNVTSTTNAVESSGSSETTQAPVEGTSSPEAMKSSKDTLVIAMSGDFANLGKTGVPAQNGRMLFSLCGATLLSIIESDDGSYKWVADEKSPCESYQWSDDGLILTIKLKKGVMMQDGTEMNADDIIDGIKIKALGSSSFLFDYDNISKTDDYTVVVPFTAVSVNNINDVGEVYVFSKEAREACANDDLFFASDAFVSCGPYKITEWVTADHVTFVKNDTYFVSNDSTIKTITVREIDESNVAMMELQTGGIDVIQKPAQSDINDVIAGKYENIKYETTPGLYCQGLYFNLAATSPSSNLLVRQAICYAIDRKSIWEGAYESGGTFLMKTQSQTFEFMETLTEEPYAQDIAKAKELMAQAGYSDGLKMKLYVDNDSQRMTAAEMISNQLGEIGITLEIVSGDNATYLKNLMNTSDWDLEIGRSGSVGSIGFNSVWLANLLQNLKLAPEDFKESFTSAGAQLLSTTDDAQRLTLTQEWTTRFWNEWLTCYLIQQMEYASLVNSSLMGFERIGDYFTLNGAYFAE